MKKIYFCILIVFFGLALARCSNGVSSTTALSSVAAGSISIDGRADDWDEIAALTSEVGLLERGNAAPRIDLKSIKAVSDGDNLYLLLEAKPVSGGVAHIYIDSDANAATGVDGILMGRKMDVVKLNVGWDYIVKLTYSSYGGGIPLLISQVERFEKVAHGHKSELVFEHKDNKDNPSYVGATGSFQELRIPLEVLAVKPPTDLVFLFMEGKGGMSTEYDTNCQLIKAKIE
ncbi:hypothetical protein ACFL38_05530 [Candidatus Omnitrophota bacterium]